MNKQVVPPPMWLLLELTYRCPLQCPYCSNPLDLGKGGEELTTEEWFRVLEEARMLGALQVGFSGGEPLLRKDLPQIVRKARDLGYYTNLITAGMGATKELFTELKDAGLDHIQVSFESKRRDMDKFVTGSEKSYDQKIEAARIVKELGYPLVFNCVIHKHNIAQIGEIIDFAAELQADYVELANTQYHGWALKNIAHLLPTKEQIDEAFVISEARKPMYPNMDIIFVIPDYYESRPKPCMQGLGSIFLSIDPNGNALPCHSAKILPMTFPNVKEHSIQYIWQESESFRHVRDRESWMKEPCKTCPEKELDFGGCRCQAYALTGDMYVADPVCDKSPHHSKLLENIANAQRLLASPLTYRNIKNVP